MADRLKTLMTSELASLITERDEHRKKSLMYKEAAEKVDKQVNRLQHFLTDYDSIEVELPDAKPKKKSGTNMEGRKSSNSPSSIPNRINAILKEAYPNYLSASDIRGYLELDGFGEVRGNYAYATLSNAAKSGKMETADGPTGKMYRLVIPNLTVDGPNA